MNRKILISAVIKTILICVSIFILIFAGGIYYIEKNFQPSKDIKFDVVVASQDIPQNIVITEDMIKIKTVNHEVGKYDMFKLEDIVGKKTKTEIKAEDFVASYNLLDTSTYNDSERIIVIPMDNEQRVANLVKKGELVDLKVRQFGIIPKTVLSKMVVEDVLDETGNTSSVTKEDLSSQNRKFYIKLILNKNQRDRVYVAQEYGKLFLELYKNNIQLNQSEDFIVPQEYLTNLGTYKKQ